MSEVREPAGGAVQAGDFVRVCSLDEIPEDGGLGVEVGDTPVVIARSGEEVYALYDSCSHAEVALSEGEVYDGTLECWLHGSCFDLRTGNPTNPPATRPVPVYPVQIDGEDVYVSLNGTS